MTTEEPIGAVADRVRKPDPNDWSWWHDALNGNVRPVHENEPKSGYYRMKAKKFGQWIPVAIWRDEEGAMLALVGENTPVDPQDIWTFCCTYPIQYDFYIQARTEGGFIDNVPHVEAPDYDGPYNIMNALRRELEQEREAFDTDGHTAPKAAAWTKRVSKLRTRADNARKAEKEPFKQIGDAIDKKWSPIISDIEDLLNELKDQAA